MLLTLLSVLALQGDAKPPTARIDFPRPSALTQAKSIRVRGAAVDAASGVAAVRVNGVPTSTSDGYATWWAMVPLEFGENALVVETLDAAGNLDPAAATTVVRRDELILGTVWYVAVDSAGGFAYVLDQARDTPSVYPWARVVRVDLESGAMSLVSSRYLGSGPLSNMNTGMGEMDWDVRNRRLVLTNAHPGELHAIDVATGDRSVLVGAATGSGPSIDYCWGLELDPTGPRAWVLRSDSSAADEGGIIEVDLTTGDRTLVTTASDGNQPWPFILGRLELLPDGQRLAFADQSVVTAVEIAGGQQSTLSDDSPAFGEDWEVTSNGGLAFGPQGRGWVASSIQNRVFALDPASGLHAPVLESPLNSTPHYMDLELDPQRGRLLALDMNNALLLGVPFDGSTPTVVAQSAIGGGYSLGSSKLYVMAPEGERALWLVDQPRCEVLRVGLGDGRRSLVSGPDLGAGPPLALPQDAVFDDSAASPRLLVVDRELGALFGVDAASGDRTLLSGQGVGGGVPFEFDGFGERVFLDRIGGTAYVADFGPSLFERRLLAVDLATGDRTLVSGGGVGSGPTLSDVHDLVIDPLLGRALVASSGKLTAVDLTSGARSELSGPNHGSGPSLGYLQAMVWDADGQRALTVGIDAEVIAVDGSTGERTLVYQRDHAVGPGFYYGTQRVALLRPAPGAAPLLVYTDVETLGIGVIDLSIDPTTGTAPGHHALLSR